MNARRLAQVLVPPLVSAIAILLLWEAIVTACSVPAWLLPPPTAIVRALWTERTQLSTACLVTLSTAAAGFFASAIVGVLFAVVLSLSRWLERGLLPHALVLQTVPIVAIAPLLVLWFGAGPRAVAASAFIVSVFPVITNTLAGLRSVDPALGDLFTLYGASRLARLVKLELPHAALHIGSGLRVACGLAVVGAVVGEFVAGVSDGRVGLGMIVMSTYRQLRTDLLFAALSCATGLGMLMFGLVSLASTVTLRRFRANGAG